MICEKCGNINDEGVRFCTECGSPLFKETLDSAVEQVNTGLNHAAEEAEDFIGEVEQTYQPYKPEPAPEPKPQPKPAPAVVPAAPVKQEKAPQEEKAPKKGKAPKEKKPLPKETRTVRTGTFFILELLFAIPVVGLLLAIIVSAASGRSLSRRNFCKSVITWHLICLAILVVIGVAGVILNRTSSEPILNWLNNELTYNSYKNCNSLFDVAKDLFTYGLQGIHFR